MLLQCFSTIYLQRKETKIFSYYCLLLYANGFYKYPVNKKELMAMVRGEKKGNYRKTEE